MRAIILRLHGEGGSRLSAANLGQFRRRVGSPSSDGKELAAGLWFLPLPNCQDWFDGKARYCVVDATFGWMDASVLVGLFATLTMLSLRDPELHVWRDAARPGALIMLDAVIDWTKR